MKPFRCRQCGYELGEVDVEVRKVVLSPKWRVVRLPTSHVPDPGDRLELPPNEVKRIRASIKAGVAAEAAIARSRPRPYSPDAQLKASIRNPNQRSPLVLWNRIVDDGESLHLHCPYCSTWNTFDAKRLTAG